MMSAPILTWFCTCQMTAKARKPELTVIAGCLEGLSSCLVNFTQSAEEGEVLSTTIPN